MAPAQGAEEGSSGGGWRGAAAAARAGLPARPEEWDCGEVGRWAEAVAGIGAARVLKSAGVDGECLLGLPDVFEKCGLPLPQGDGCSRDVGGLFRLRHARLALAPPWQRVALDPDIATVLGLVPAEGWGGGAWRTVQEERVGRWGVTGTRRRGDVFSLWGRRSHSRVPDAAPGTPCEGGEDYS